MSRPSNPFEGIDAPRSAVVAGIVGFAIVWPIGYVLYNAGLIEHRYKDLGTLIDVLSFVIPFVIVRHLHNRRTRRPK